MLDVTHQRFRLIELLSWWEGGVNATHLIKQFSITRQHASRLFKEYGEQHKTGALYYDATLKMHVPDAHYRPQWISGDVSEYLQWFATGILNEPGAIGIEGSGCEVLRHPMRKVSHQIIRALVYGIKHQHRVDVGYVSLKTPDTEGRIIVPHTFVNTGLRWHLRAYCQKREGYRDFVLSRFRGEADVMDPSPYGIAQDTAWNTQITLVLEPDHRLTPEQREVLENDYQMQNGQLHIQTRAALATYVLQEMQVNTKFLDAVPEAQQLVLVNKSDVSEWLFSG